MTEPDSRLAAGIHPVRELLRAGGPVTEILLARAGERGVVAGILDLAADAGVPVRRVSDEQLDALTPDVAHQGIAARAPAFPYRRLSPLLDRLEDADEPPLIVALDHLTDPRNVGAIARSAEAAGAHAMLLPGRRAAGVTTVTESAAAGALAHLPVVRETNLATALRTCRDAGLWIVGLAASGDVDVHDCELLSEPLVVVVGEEGAGMARLSRQLCDQTVAVPLRGRVESLNASVAAAVVLFEADRRRRAPGT